jgi:hypothetical protein
MNNLSETEVEHLQLMRERLRGEAYDELVEAVSTNDISLRQILLAAAQAYVDEANLLCKLQSMLSDSPCEPQHKIVSVGSTYKIIPV